MQYEKTIHQKTGSIMNIQLQRRKKFWRRYSEGAGQRPRCRYAPAAGKKADLKHKERYTDLLYIQTEEP